MARKISLAGKKLVSSLNRGRKMRSLPGGMDKATRQQYGQVKRQQYGRVKSKKNLGRKESVLEEVQRVRLSAREPFNADWVAVRLLINRPNDLKAFVQQLANFRNPKGNYPKAFQEDIIINGIFDVGPYALEGKMAHNVVIERLKKIFPGYPREPRWK